ncbi:MAG: hypothetical protein AAF629_34205 [Chloroflexota bacterium]
MMTTPYHLEIEDLHKFFVDWFCATLPQTKEAFHRFSGVMAAEMHMTTPDGQKLSNEQLIKDLWQAYGHRHMQRDYFRIWIENIQIQSESSTDATVSYEEWQQIDDKGTQTRRQSSVLFRRRKDTPNGLEWVKVHETWLKDLPKK